MKKNKVVVCIMGGIGNQLFTYAAARRLALVNGAELVLDVISGFAHDELYRRHYQLDSFNVSCKKANAAERFEPFSRYRRYFLKIWNSRLPLEKRSYLVQDGVDFDPRLLGVKVQGSLYLEGYWQSEKYFNDIEDVIRNDLQILAPSDSANLAVAEKIRGCMSVAVHVRFFDEPNANDINNAPIGYYGRALNVIEKIAPEAHYFIFSDQPNAVKSYVPLPESRYTIVSHNQGDKNAYADLWLMTQCKHFIIANSTFSWWGAWLGRHEDKQVIAPGFEKREGKTWWGFKGLLPEKWIKL